MDGISSKVFFQVSFKTIVSSNLTFRSASLIFELQLDFLNFNLTFWTLDRFLKLQLDFKISDLSCESKLDLLEINLKLQFDFWQLDLKYCISTSYKLIWLVKLRFWNKIVLNLSNIVFCSVKYWLELLMINSTNSICVLNIFRSKFAN